MDSRLKSIIWNQFGAAIDALENAMAACPDDLWRDRTRQPEFWYVAYHALFWLDFYLSASVEDFAPPAPFGLEELDPAGKLPDRLYTKDELRAYLRFGRRKCKDTIDSLTDEKAGRPFNFGRVKLSFAELLLYNMRHVQHHAGQLNLALRQATDSAPGWVFGAED
ncbi:MAG: DinB family protein [Candidatus Zixiibacteriota bacterium]|nr:MAG: DinB family protein [candidate division Zixibacteria bacterium]